MNITAPQESSRINQDLYKSMTPTKRRTFSEYMLRRRSPFLRSEDSQNNITLPKIYPRPLYKRLKYTENDEKLAKSPGNCKKKIVAGNSTATIKQKTTDYLKWKDKQPKQNQDLNIANKPKPLEIKSPLNSHDNEMNIRANGIETSTTEYHFEVETENWLKIKQDIKKLKDRNEISTNRNKRNANEMEKNVNEMRQANSSKLQQISATNISKLRDIETEIETSYSAELTQISGYYSDETSNENSIKYTDKLIKPLTNSTFIYQAETSGNETNEYQTASESLAEITNNSKRNETYLLENKNEANNIETGNSNKNNHKEDSMVTVPSTKKYPLYQPHNFQIPLIIINEIEIINYGLETVNESEIKPLKTLKVPAIPLRTEFEENKELQKKLNEMEHFKQIEIKDKVMSQLLEIAISLDFPKLKHLCNILCEKNEDGLCLKNILEAEKNNKHEESSGFFQTLWSAFKYPFVANTNTTDDKECQKIQDNRSKEEKMKEVNTKDDKGLKQEDEKGNSMAAENDKNNNKAENRKLDECLDFKETKKELNEKKDENKLDQKGLEWENKEKHVINLEETAKESNNVNKVEIKDQDREAEKADNSEYLKDKVKSKESPKLPNNCDKIIISQEDNNIITEADTNDKITQENKTKNISEDNLNTKNDKSSLEHSKKENSCMKPVEKQNVKKKSKKSNKGFFSFFYKAEKPNKENSLEDPNKIEDMEDTLEELERAENEKLLQISGESLKKLNSFLAEKNKLQCIDSKARSKRSDSF